jgi:hypothetical protein
MSQNGSASTPPVPGHATNLPAVSNPTDNCPAAKKQKLNPVPSTQSSASALKDNEIKQEPNIPKSAKVSNWAPEGYYFVKAVSCCWFLLLRDLTDCCHSTSDESRSERPSMQKLRERRIMHRQVLRSWIWMEFEGMEETWWY